jgi:ribose-phosphate pyrophosphokinase
MRRVINLDPTFTPFAVPDISFSKKMFPGGEAHIQLNKNVDYDEITDLVITARPQSAVEIMEIALAKSAIDGLTTCKVSLFIPYLPYARQDRYCAKGQAFSLDAFASMLNSLKFDKITTIDAHSEVAVDLIDNLQRISMNKFAEEAYADMCERNPAHNVYVVSPDKGARKKTKRFMEYIVKSRDFMIRGKKKRNPYTGEISGFKVDVKTLGGAPCLIVDDICDGGGTFIGLAKKLKKAGAGPISLYTTHGIYSRGTGILDGIFDQIYTTNSFRRLYSHQHQSDIQLIEI